MQLEFGESAASDHGSGVVFIHNLNVFIACRHHSYITWGWPAQLHAAPKRRSAELCEIGEFQSSPGVRVRNGIRFQITSWIPKLQDSHQISSYHGRSYPEFEWFFAWPVYGSRRKKFLAVDLPLPTTLKSSAVKEFRCCPGEKWRSTPISANLGQGSRQTDDAPLLVEACSCPGDASLSIRFSGRRRYPLSASVWVFTVNRPPLCFGRWCTLCGALRLPSSSVQKLPTEYRPCLLDLLTWHETFLVESGQEFPLCLQWTWIGSCGWL